MQIRKLNYFFTYEFPHHLFLSVICAVLCACAAQNSASNAPPPENLSTAVTPPININTASAVELEKLPHIGAKTAAAIIEQREKFGRFRKPEHLLLVRGISDAEFREIKNMVAVE